MIFLDIQLLEDCVIIWIIDRPIGSQYSTRSWEAVSLGGKIWPVYEGVQEVPDKMWSVAGSHITWYIIV